MTQNKETKTYKIDKISLRTGGYKNHKGTWINPSDKEAKRELLTKYEDFEQKLEEEDKTTLNIQVRQTTHPDPKNPNKKIYTETHNIKAKVSKAKIEMKKDGTFLDKKEIKKQIEKKGTEIREADTFTGENKEPEKKKESPPEKYGVKIPRVVIKAGSLNTALKVLEQTPHGIENADELLSEAMRLSDNILRYTHQNTRP